MVNKLKKILLLGGSTQQIPAIEYANSKGYYTILCDYLTDNPGQKYARKFYCVSTTDKDAILEVAKKEAVDGIVAYASDPAAPTAAYVAEQLGLPTNPYKAVETLAYKHQFRKFLFENDFNCPQTATFTERFPDLDDVKHLRFPVMVKPIDSSGSKGVAKVDLSLNIKDACKIAYSHSRKKMIIIEEYVEKDHPFMIGGDCFVNDGKVVYWGLLNCYRDSSVNLLVPVGKSYPICLNEFRVNKIKKEIQRVVDLLGLKSGAFNLEVIVDKNDNVFLIEMGPRNGGNMIPDFLKLIHNVDLIGATIETAIGNDNIELNQSRNDGFYATYNIHSARNGCLLNIRFAEEIQNNILRKVVYKSPGDNVEFFDGANKALGIVFLKFISQDELLSFTSYPECYIQVELV